jgi:hypothetical protein
VFYPDQVKVVKELSKMRLVVRCPEKPTYLTCVKASGLFWFKRLKSLCGARSEEDVDTRETSQDAGEKKTGIPITEGAERQEQVAHEYERMKRQLATELKQTLHTGEELKILKGLSALDFDALMDLGIQLLGMTTFGLEVFLIRHISWKQKGSRWIARSVFYRGDRQVDRERVAAFAAMHCFAAPWALFAEVVYYGLGIRSIRWML